MFGAFQANIRCVPSSQVPQQGLDMFRNFTLSFLFSTPSFPKLQKNDQKLFQQCLVVNLCLIQILLSILFLC